MEGDKVYFHIRLKQQTILPFDCSNNEPGMVVVVVVL